MASEESGDLLGNKPSSSSEDNLRSPKRRRISIESSSFPTATAAQPPVDEENKPWAKLISTSPKQESFDIYPPTYTVGSSSTCNLVLVPASDLLCKISKDKLSSLPILKVTGAESIVFVESEAVNVNEFRYLLSGYSVGFGSQEVELAFIFRNMSSENDSELPQASTSGNGLPYEYVRDGIVEGKSLEVTFEKFEYYLSEITKNGLIDASQIHLKKNKLPKDLSYLATFNPRILLSGPAGSELCQEMLAKALAKHFDAKLLIFDCYHIFEDGLALSGSLAASSCPDSQPNLDAGTSVPSLGTPVNHTLKEGDRIRYHNHETSTLRGPPHGTEGKVVLVFGDNPSHQVKVGVRFDKPIPDGIDLGALCEKGHGFFCHAAHLRVISDDQLINTLFEVVRDESKTSPLILFLEDADKSVVENPDSYSAFQRNLEHLPENVVVIGSQTHPDRHQEKSMEVPVATNLLTKLFGNEITIRKPKDEHLLASWNLLLDRDAETLKKKANIKYLRMVLGRFKLDCEGIGALCIKDLTLDRYSAEKIIGWACSDHLRGNPDADPDTRVNLSLDSINYGIRALQAFLNESTSSKDIAADEFTKRLLSDVIPPRDIDVTFKDIGALQNVKDTLKKMVMLPVKRAELFCKGKLTKTCKGILLFGPPGTGKTMLAKAVASEAGANFINISMSSITSKWFGEPEKYVKAVFTLASKISPSVIFVDEVDSMLGGRENPGEPQAMRRLKNEFMINWDGLRTKENERVLVLAATNRPFDLDEAVIRRFPHRLMVGLPDSRNRSQILKAILAEEDLSDDVDLDVVASIADRYSGSDLKNLCVTAAYPRIIEILEKEESERDAALAEGKDPPPLRGTSDIRALNMQDFRHALEECSTSISSESRNLVKLQEWNNIFGDGGSRKQASHSYYS